MKSLRIRLLILLGVAILASATLQFFASLQTAMGQANRLFDYHMEQMALALQDSDFSQARWQNPPASDTHNFDFVIQVWTEEGAQVYQSRPYRALPTEASLGYATVTLDNGDWRTYGVRSRDRVIQVVQKLDARRDRAVRLALRSLWPEIPISLLLFVAAWAVVTSTLKPLNRIGRDLARRNADSLEAVSVEGVPKEVYPLIAEMNLLFGRVSQSVKSQQRFVADAAHELRSPLTALKLQAQTLARAKDEESREQAINRLLGGVDRASRLVEQLLALARHDPSAEAPEPAHMVFAECVELAVADVATFAASRGILLDFKRLAQNRLIGDRESLRIMVRNLLDNAIRYSPQESAVRIDLAARDGQLVLSIEDAGPGIPAEDQDRVFDRFYRVPGTGPTGSGLGLAIIKAIAERHNAKVSLAASSMGGLRVNVVFALSEAFSDAIPA